MNPIEEYFFSNNIAVWSTKTAGDKTYYNTSEGEFVSHDLTDLVKIGKGNTPNQKVLG
ncbi:hypothetical protein P7D81_20350 [Enterococcus avium]|jgi:hypothetical protein|uniref:hypothetical protein n=1 Tax=Enterococcus avium TaxID=33945 RepID=UPI00288E2B70|nr:hypothetical protein [Enterococcus avium]MDT2416092.1 hypothetical protein [Enterococcus avium]MDT2476846.1 hypothetical protein [Enterococcus avium]